MISLLEQYEPIVGEDVVRHLRQIAKPLSGMKVVHVNSTYSGGGVAEILIRLVPLMKDLGLDVSWKVITGEADFYQCTRRFHDGLQGNAVLLPERLLAEYEGTNQRNAEELRATLEDADIVFIHDPQPAPLLRNTPNRKGKWIWRCHIDMSRPYRPVWKYLRPFIADYDASIFSLADFAQPLPHTQYLVPPSIDPISEKNMELPEEEIREVFKQFKIDPERPLLVQVSRFDRFKDPIGVIRSYGLAKRFVKGIQLVLAGGGASDDPEGEIVLKEVYEAARGDDDIHVLLLPSDANRTINALQRAADIVMQKSIREGFGLTVTEAMWKSKTVIGGDTGGIRLQVVNHHTGFLVSTPEGAALRVQYLLRHKNIQAKMETEAKRFVLENFLVTRHLREYLTIMVAMVYGSQDRIELG